MSEQLANNYELLNRVISFENVYIEPLKKDIDNVEKAFSDVKFKWKPGQKDKAEKKYELICDRYNDFRMFIEDVRKLVNQHEKLVDVLCGIYDQWIEKVAYKGKQPPEMMSEQIIMLQQIFTQLYEIVKPVLGEELKAPDNG